MVNLKTDKSIQEDKDVLGGTGGALESNAYEFAIDMAYFDEAKSGAISVTMHFVTPDKRTLRITEYVTSGKAKGQKNYYETKQGERRYLPGFTTINNICLLTVGEELGDLDAEEKLVKIWDFEQRKEVPTPKQVIMGLIGQRITLGVLKTIQDITAKTDGGEYEPTGYTRIQNEVSKAFRSDDNLTVAEIKAEATESVFYNQWIEKYADVTIDKSAAKAGHNPKPTGTADAGAANNAGNTSAEPAKEKKPLFGKKD